MRLLFSWILVLLGFTVFSQDVQLLDQVPTASIDSLYREDQFYGSFGLNTLKNKPSGLLQDTFSPGLTFGFLRDFPVLKNRRVAIAPGIGFAYHDFNQNMKMEKYNQLLSYSIIDSNVDYKKNRFSLCLVELPIEVRWRNSTFESYKFWRVYGGFKVGYLLYNRSVYTDSFEKIIVTNNPSFNKIQYSSYLSVGYNSINVYACYSLNSLLKNATIATETIQLNALNIGIVFYVL